MPAKIVVTSVEGGSRISLLGSGGKELLGSTVFAEPRAKGATLRALKGLFGEMVVEDHTLKTTPRPSVKPAPSAPAGPVTPKVVASSPPAPRKARARKKTGPGGD